MSIFKISRLEHLLDSSKEMFPKQDRLPDLFEVRDGSNKMVVFARQNVGMVIGGALSCIIVLVAIFAPWIAQNDPFEIVPSLRNRDPSSEFWFGSDALGRDVFARVVYGARVSITVGLAVAALASLVGLCIGLFAGYVRWLDGVVMRIMDGIMSIPSILLAISLMALTQPSVLTVIVAITIAEIPRVARVVRGEVLRLRDQPYVEAAITSGTSTLGVIIKHILPNTIAPIIVQATYIFAGAMITEAILSFIGAGTPPSVPSWGNIVGEGRALWQIKPHLIFFPAVFLSVSVLAVNLLGDGLRDLLDPRISKRN